MAKVNIPSYLLDQLRDGRVFLFLGSGASIGAIHPENKKIPTNDELRDQIAKKFLNDKFLDYPLAQVAELAISESDLFSVQSFIASLFYDFEPSSFHKLIPKFVWSAIATTNYDLLIEKSYDQDNNPLQKLVPFRKDGERVKS